MMKPIAIAAALLTLASCGPLNEGSAARGFLSVVQARVGGLTGGAAAQPPAPVLTRAQADANPGAFLLVKAYGGTSEASLVQAGANGSRVTWLSADNVSVTLENGIIVATRGFPEDLMAADVRGVRQAIAAGGGQATRVHETLDDTDQVSQQVLQCSIAAAGSETVEILGKSTPTRKVSEACRGESIAFTNTYWVSPDGAIIRSEQLVARRTGFVQLERP